MNGTANNYLESQSSSVILDIIPQDETTLNVSTTPTIIRILKQFQVEAILKYKNGTAIPDQQVYINITIEKVGKDRISFVVEETTDVIGTCTYDYLIGADYKDGTITINVSYNGLYNKKASIIKMED